MGDKNILHMLTPLKHVSPFDTNMALDAGYDAVIPYSGVERGEIASLVQDAIFSRPPKLGARTGFFFGGKDAFLALDMLDAAKKAMVPPFGASLFADPAGSFTTAAAMVTCVESTLRHKLSRTLDRLAVAVFGATGVVGFSSAVIAARQGAKVTLVGYDGVERVCKAAEEAKRRFDVALDFADGSSHDKIGRILSSTQVVLCAGRAGVRILDREQLQAAPDLLIAADVNAVPPSGVEGLKVDAKGEPVGESRALGVGALTIGQLKSKTELGLFRQMIAAEKPVALDFRHAFELARELAK
ncbi:MAG: methylenetetrahydromethanopterin dehydrogenase [Hyphomicrobiales bacterium]|nr:methylenetetrahydromethanopterin dehydrogenase [Hyphomicrobiales bacterium]MBV9976420.1 methylenetetrahydromethanopterin dehydrogenase [Hyphomicrobiales bacterium]